MSLVAGYMGDQCGAIEYDHHRVTGLGGLTNIKMRAGGSSSSPVSSSSSSSIGKPDDDSDDDADEVQSTLSLGSLEDSLPIKRGLSKHYGGKSKSFGNLGQVKCVEELIKSDNPFNKRRRTLMALNLHNHDLKKRNQKSFYSHSSHISMPLLPLLEEDDDDDDCRPPAPPRISLQCIKEQHHQLPPLYPTDAHPCT